ncbi:hypothetical protein ACI784_17995 [Geodermatophilus sp. SYSU D01186]
MRRPVTALAAGPLLLPAARGGPDADGGAAGGRGAPEGAHCDHTPDLEGFLP